MAFAVQSSGNGRVGSADVVTHDYASRSLTSRFSAANEPFFSVDSPSLMSRLTTQPGEDLTFAQKVLPNTTYDASSVAVQANTFADNAPVYGGAQVAQKVEIGAASIQETQARFVADFKEAQNFLGNHIATAAQESGYDRGITMRSLGAVDDGATKLGIVAGSVGLGNVPALVTGVGFSYQVLNEINQEKRIPKEELDKIVQKALERIQLAQKGGNDASFSAPEDGKPAAPPPKFDFTQIDTQQAITFMGADPHKQPEFEKLASQFADVERLRANHKHVHDNPYVSLAGLNGGAGSAAVEDSARRLALQEDAVGFQLGGDSLSGISAMTLKVAAPMPTVEQYAKALEKEAKGPAVVLEVQQNMGFKLA